MANQIENQDIFKKIIEADQIPVTPNPAIEERVNYYYRLQHSRHKVHSNSFAGCLGWILSGKALILKTGLAIAAAVFFMVKSPVIQNTSVITADTCTHKVLLTDTNTMVKDTCLN
jgi:hypothetical protein